MYRKPLPRDVKNELQAVVAFSLAGTIRQISSLALQAESVLGELSDTLTDYHRRTEALERRVRHLRDDILPNIGAEEKGTLLGMRHLKGACSSACVCG